MYEGYQVYETQPSSNPFRLSGKGKYKGEKKDLTNRLRSSGRQYSKTRETISKGSSNSFTKTKIRKFHQEGIIKTKRNYNLYERVVGTEKKKEYFKVPTPEKKKLRKVQEVIDNYQYHETVEIKKKDPRRKSVVNHIRLCEPVVRDSYIEETVSSKKTKKTKLSGYPKYQKSSRTNYCPVHGSY